MFTFSYYINNQQEPLGKLEFVLNNIVLNTFNSFYELTHLESLKKVDANLKLIFNIINTANYKIEISWSYDNVTYTPYSIYNDNLLQTFQYSNLDVWIKTKITQLSEGEIFINSLSYNWDRILDVITSQYVILPGETKLIKPTDIYKIFQIDDVLLEYEPSIANVSVLFRLSQNKGKNWTEWLPFNKNTFVNTRISSVLFTVFEFSICNNEITTPINLIDIDIIGKYSNITKKSNDISRLGLREACLLNGEVDTNLSTEEKYFAGCTTTPTFNPYDIKKPALFLEYINNSISSIWGKKVYYFKHTPDKDSIDYDLYEYPVMTVENGDFKELKIVIPKNQIPNNEIKFTGFNLELFENFEVHITKDEFKRAFGVNERPGKKDVLLICELNRLYEVEHVLADKGAMSTSTFYKVMLKKYNKDANTNWEDNAGFEAINNLTVSNSLDSLFKAQNNISDKNISGNVQYIPTTNINNRKLDKSTILFDYDLYNAKVLINNTVYKVPYKNKNFVYHTGGDSRLSTDESRSINLWFNLEEYNSNDFYYLVKNMYSGQGYEVFLHNDKIILNINDGTFETTFVPTENIFYLLTINIDQVSNKLEIIVNKRQTEYGNDYVDARFINVLYEKYEHTPKSFQHSGGLVFGNIITDRKTKANMYLSNLKILNLVSNIDDIQYINGIKNIKNEYKIILIDLCDINVNSQKTGNV